MCEVTGGSEPATTDCVPYAAGLFRPGESRELGEAGSTARAANARMSIVEQDPRAVAAESHAADIPDLPTGTLLRLFMNNGRGASLL